MIEYKNLEADVQKIDQSYNKIDQKFGGRILLTIYVLHLAVSSATTSTLVADTKETLYLYPS